MSELLIYNAIQNNIGLPLGADEIIIDPILANSVKVHFNSLSESTTEKEFANEIVNYLDTNSTDSPLDDFSQFMNIIRGQTTFFFH